MEMTAGEFKRTVSVFGEITEKGLKKFQEELEDTQLLFKEFVKAHRPKLDIERWQRASIGSRGAGWSLARRQLGTSDEYLVAGPWNATSTR